jgi:hypothetical protein
LRDPPTLVRQEQAALIADQQIAMSEVEQEINNALSGYEQQHRDYEQHVLTKISILEAQLRHHKGAMQYSVFRSK